MKFKDWYVRINDSNRLEAKNLWENKFPMHGRLGWENYFVVGQVNGKSACRTLNYIYDFDWKEITFQEFKNYCLSINSTHVEWFNSPKFILPRRWFCRAKNQTENTILYQWLKDEHRINVSGLFSKYDYIMSNGGYSSAIQSLHTKNPEGYTQITFDEFKEHVMKKYPIPQGDGLMSQIERNSLIHAPLDSPLNVGIGKILYDEYQSILEKVGFHGSPTIDTGKRPGSVYMRNDDDCYTIFNELYGMTDKSLSKKYSLQTPPSFKWAEMPVKMMKQAGRLYYYGTGGEIDTELCNKIFRKPVTTDECFKKPEIKLSLTNDEVKININNKPKITI